MKNPVGWIFGKLFEFLMNAILGLITWLFEAVLAVSTPNFTGDFLKVWGGRMFTIGVAMGVLFLLFHVIQAMVTGGRHRISMVDGFIGFIAFMVITPATLILIALLQSAIDSINTWLVGEVFEDMSKIPELGSKLSQALPGWIAHQSGPLLLLVGVLGTVCTMIGGVILWAILTLREYLVYLLAIMAPLILSGLAWKPTSGWIRKWAALLVAIMATPIFITITFGLSNSILIEALESAIASMNAVDADPGEVLSKDPGTAVASDTGDPMKILSFIVIAGGSFFVSMFSPWVLYKVMSDWLNLRDDAIAMEQKGGQVAGMATKDMARKFLTRSAAAAGTGGAGAAGVAAGAAAKGATSGAKSPGAFEAAIGKSGASQSSGANAPGTGSTGLGADSTRTGTSGTSSGSLSEQGTQPKLTAGADSHVRPSTPHEPVNQVATVSPGDQVDANSQVYAVPTHSGTGPREVPENSPPSPTDGQASAPFIDQRRESVSPGLLHQRQPKIKFPPMPPGHGQIK